MSTHKDMDEKYQGLFELMVVKYNLPLIESELDGIIAEVEKMQKNEGGGVVPKQTEEGGTIETRAGRMLFGFRATPGGGRYALPRRWRTAT